MISWGFFEAVWNTEQSHTAPQYVVQCLALVFFNRTLPKKKICCYETNQLVQGGHHTPGPAGTVADANAHCSMRFMPHSEYVSILITISWVPDTVTLKVSGALGTHCLLLPGPKPGNGMPAKDLFSQI